MKSLKLLLIILVTYYIYFTETWLNSDISDKVLSIQGYDIIRKGRINRNGGDIIIYVRNDLQYETIQLPHLNYEIMPIVFPSIKTILIALYHHYWGNSKHHSTTIDILYNIINSHHSRNTNHITIVGDFNDLVHHIHAITVVYKLTNIVKFNTRQNKTIGRLCRH